MAHFNFQLDGVLRHRRNVEHERQRDVALVQAQLTKLESQLRALDDQVRASNDDARQNHLTGRIDPNFLAAHRRYLSATQRRAIEIAAQMATVQRQLDEARKLLADAARDRRVLERLREKQQAAWQAERNRLENAALDEVAMQMSYRGREDPT